MSKVSDNQKLSKKLLKIAEDEALRQSLLFKTDSLIKNKGVDSSLDIENEKFHLINGAEFSIAGLKKYIADSVRDYSPKFRLKFYEEIFRLKGWKKEDAKNYLKPAEVAHITNEFIYGRFPREVLPVIQWRNKFVFVGDGIAIRANKNFQLLTEKGENMLLSFIEEAIDVMENSESWHEFTVKYSNKFGLPFQTSLFDSNNV